MLPIESVSFDQLFIFCRFGFISLPIVEKRKMMWLRKIAATKKKTRKQYNKGLRKTHVAIVAPCHHVVIQ